MMQVWVTLNYLDGYRLITFTSSDECINYIISLKTTNEAICLITSGSLGVTVIPSIHNIDQIESIIVFCMEKTKYEFMQKRYNKIRHVLNTYNELIIQLQIYLKSIDRDGTTVNIFNIENLKKLRNCNSVSKNSHLPYTIFNDDKQCSMRDISKSDTFFLWLKLLTSVLQKVHHTQDTMNEMLDKCREYHKDNIEELNKIDEFKRTYRKEDAIYWYTTPTFVSKLINKALCTEDFRALYICRAYIADLSEQLHLEYEQYKQLLIDFEQPLNQWTVYHGRAMSKDELDILCNKKGQLISLNGFLSTSRKEEVADCYSKEVMFIIQTTFDLTHGCFAHVAPMSQFPSEDEVLFDLASVFKILDIKYDRTTNKWNVYLITTDEGTSVVQAYIDSAEIEANETNVDFIFARLLIQMGEYSLAHDYLDKLFAMLSSEHDNRDIALVYYYRGLIFYREGNYAQSMIEYERALTIQRKIFPEGHSDLGESLGGIGLLYDNMGQYNLALEKHLEGLAVSEKTLPKDHVHIAEALNNIALSHFDEALMYYMRDLTISEKTLPDNHAEIGITHHNLGQVYRAKDRGSDLAVKHYQTAIDIYMKTLPRQHPYIGFSLMYIAEVLSEQNNLEAAFRYATEAVSIVEATLSDDHRRRAEATYILAIIYKKMHQIDKSLEYAYKARDIQLRTLDGSHKEVQKTLELIQSIEQTDHN
ncbi:hypothetical protein I4U23_003598 [Adineta vaga]|nr:hypothetical protein I4U23_003598 [Adineta vaga]